MSPQSKPKPPDYNEALRSLLTECSELIIPVVNEVFSQHHTGEEKVIFDENNCRVNLEDENNPIADIYFSLVNPGGEQEDYHIECCPHRIDTFTLYNALMYKAISGGVFDDASYSYTVKLPNSAIFNWHHDEDTPNEIIICCAFPDSEGEAKNVVPVVKVQNYEPKDIWQKNLLLFIPYNILRHERNLPEYNNNDEELAKLKDEYADICHRLHKMCADGQIAKDKGRQTMRVLAYTARE